MILDLTHLRPLGARVWYTRPEAPNQIGTIWLPPATRESYVGCQGEVVALGPQVQEPVLCVGAWVVVPRFGAVEVGQLASGEPVWACEEREVRAVIG